MNITRKIDVANRVFTVSDLVRFARILNVQTSGNLDRPISTQYSASFQDALVIEGSADEVFREDELNRPNPPVEIEMHLHQLGKHSIRINLRAGDGYYGNSIVISSNDPEWSNANFTALRDCLDKVAPQRFWWKKHPMLLLNLLAMSIGVIIWSLMEFSVEHVLHTWPNIPAPTLSPSWKLVFLQYFLVFSWIWRWVLGAPYAFWIRNWLLKMWPSVEFDFGSPYLRPSRRRQRLYAVLTLGIVPITVAVLYDALKTILR